VSRLVAFLLVGLPMASAASAKNDSPPAFEREIRTPGAGLVAVRLDRHVYEAARSDLGDLRVLEESATSVPYTLDRGFPPASPERRPEIRNRGVVPAGAATAVLDFGERVTKTRLALRLGGDNFRRRVVVEGSDDGRSWVTLTDEGWVFAIPGVEPVRYEVVTLPENDFAQLRVTVHPDPRERKRVSIEEAWLPSGEHRARREETLAPQWSRAAVKDSRETWLTVDLGARHQPFQGIVLEVEDERFFREVRVEAREDPVLSASESVAPPDQWRAVGDGVIFRQEHAGELRESLRVDVAGRARVVRLRIRNRDDRPLRVTDVSVAVPVERLLFEAADGDHTLTYGAPKLTAPTYDLARTLDDEPVTSVATLGPPVRRDVVADILPWTERHPVLLWAGLLMVVAALGAVTWRALRSA
jgi:hypothetical protein